MEEKKNLLNQIEKDFKEGKAIIEECNKGIDELLIVNPLGRGMSLPSIAKVQGGLLVC